LQLALNDDPAAKTYQQAMFDKNKPAALFNVDDVQKEHDRMKPLGAEFTMPPTKVTGSTIAMLKDGCGNIVQLVKLDQWKK
jgi:predicted enzyme related to lactoylglutathione lyase